MANEIKITVRVRNMVAKGLNAAKRSLNGFQTFSSKVLGPALKTSVGVAAAAFVGLGATIKKAFEFETYKTQFATLLGSMDAAKKRFADLVEFSEKTPFSPKEIVQASKSLEQFGFVGEQNVRTLQRVGDAAASLDPSKLQEIAFAFGRLRAGAAAGAVGEPTMRLLELGIISAETKKRMEELAKETQDVGAVMALLDKDLAKYNGGMERLSQTGAGLLSTFFGKIEVAMATFGEALLGFSKDTLKEANDAITRFTNSDTFDEWAKRTANALQAAKDLLTDLFSGDQAVRGQAFSDLKTIFMDAASGALSILLDGAVVVGKLIGEGVKMAAGIGGPSSEDIKAATESVIAQGKTVTRGNRGGTFQAADPEAVKEEAEKLFRERLRRESGINVASNAAEVIKRRAAAAGSSGIATSAAQAAAMQAERLKQYEVSNSARKGPTGKRGDAVHVVLEGSEQFTRVT